MIRDAMKALVEAQSLVDTQEAEKKHLLVAEEGGSERRKAIGTLRWMGIVYFRCSQEKRRR